MAFHIAQCPCCSSTFSVSEQLLNSASGKVRCGACLCVFLAKHNFVNSKSELEDSEADDSVFVSKAPEDYFDPAGFLTRKALRQKQEVDSNEVNLEPIYSQKKDAEPLLNSDLTPSSSTASPDSAEDPESMEDFVAAKGSSGDPTETIGGSVEMAEQKTDNTPARSWIGDLPPSSKDVIGPPHRTVRVIKPELRHLPIEQPQPSQHNSHVGTECAQLSAPNRSTASAESAAQTGPSDGNKSAKRSEQELEPRETPSITDGHPQANRKGSETDVPGNPSAEGESVQAATKIEKFRHENSSGAIRDRALRMELNNDQALEQLAAENLATLQNFSAPVELRSDSHARWGRTLTSLLAAGILGISLAGQHLWRNQEHFSQQARWRPFLERVCVIRACDLPMYEDLTKIVSANLSVRSHPKRPDAIIIQIQIRNTAPFAQAFPIMIVSFNTADNEVIAMREFSPAEYLQTDLPEFSAMPVMAPVPINLELMDPGEDAVNYTLAFRRP